MPFNALNRDSELNYICKTIRPSKNDKKNKEKINVRRNTNSSRSKRVVKKSSKDLTKKNSKEFKKEKRESTYAKRKRT